MILIRQEEKQGKARKSKERIEKARNNSGDRWRSPGYRTYNIYRLTRSGLGFASLGLDLKVWACICKPGHVFASLACICKSELVFVGLGLYL